MTPTSKPLSPNLARRNHGDQKTEANTASGSLELSSKHYLESLFSEKPLANPEDDYMGQKEDVTVEPFSLLGSILDLDEVQAQLPSSARISDAYPCTGLQEGLLALSMKSGGSFTPQIICKLPVGVNIEKFKSAWQISANSNMTLRTTFVQTRSAGLLQLVMEPESICWSTADDLHEYLSHDRAIIPDFGTPLVRYGLVRPRDLDCIYFVWTFSHAIIDGWAMRLLLKQVDDLYRDEPMIQLVEFNCFIAFHSRMEKAMRSKSRQFWESHLAESKSSLFPSRKSISHQSHAGGYRERYIPMSENLLAGATSSTIIQAAWGILLARKTAAAEATYGLVLAGRNSTFKGVRRVNGPTFTTVPMRVWIDNEQSAEELFAAIHASRVAMKPYQHIGLQNLRKLNDDCARACNFQNLLVIQPKLKSDHDSLFYARENTSDHWAKLNAYPLMMQCELTKDGFTAMASFDNDVLLDQEVDVLLEQFVSIINQLSNSRSLVGSIGLPIQADNSLKIKDAGVEQLQSCVHDIVLQTSRKLWDEIAITSWDGDITHRQLQTLSDRLSIYLQSSGAGPGVMVALVFEKSLWVVVAILAIMKCGAVFVPMHHDHPKARIQGLVDQIGGKLMVCSLDLLDSFTGIAENTVAVGRSTVEGLPRSSTPTAANITPKSIVYVIFTSGSTGQPKGCVVDHATCCTTIEYLSKFLGLGSESRMLQLSVYTFDGCILEILAALSVGATICIPSEEEKMNNITAAINRMQVNTAFMTPSFGRLIQPKEVPTLKTLAIGGEKLVQEDLDRWVDKVRLFQVYGPTETCVICIGNEVKKRGTDPSKLGSGFIGSYIVLDESGQLVQPGGVGELLIGGPHLARGYLDDREKTESSFIATPSCIPTGSTRWERWYKTGDLVRKNFDDSFSYVARKEAGAQVKLNGQRIENGEIEAHIHKHLENVIDVASVVATPADNTRAPFLAAFVCFFDNIRARDAPDNAPILTKCMEAAAIEVLHQRLTGVLPQYMIPKVYIPLFSMPLTPSGKIDRKYLQTIASDLTLSDFAYYSSTQMQKSMPITAKEHKMQRLWGELLKLSPEAIGRNDSFRRLGGDSILAMRLVTLCRQEGLGLTVADIFRHPVLSDLAKKCTQLIDQERVEQADIVAFSMIGGVSRVASIFQNSLSPHSIRISQIEDVYPCTPFQQSIMALSVKHPGAYVSQHVFRLPNNISSKLDTFCSAWLNLVRANPILRTRIVPTQSYGLMQAVLKEDISWQTQSNLRGYLKKDKILPMGLGTPLSRYAIISDDSEDDTRHFFVWTLHHAVYDAWSLGLLLCQLENEYKLLTKSFTNNVDAKSSHFLTFNRFIQDLQVLDKANAAEFWKSQLAGDCSQPSHFPLVENEYQPQSNTVIMKDIEIGRMANSDIRLSNVIRAAWAITLSNYTNSNDVIFGEVLTGRTCSTIDSTRVVGPTLATVPVRISFHPHGTVHELLERVQNNMLHLMPFEQAGMSSIQSISSELKKACNFQNILIIQPKENSALDESFLGRRQLGLVDMSGWDTTPLTLECSLTTDGLSAKTIFDPKLISERQMDRILSQFQHILSQLCRENARKTVHDINSINELDLEHVWNWNKDLPELMETCVHYQIDLMTRENPEAQSICSWDGELTRRELDNLSSRLAHQLMMQGVRPESKVPMLFTKSKWAVVAILAVIKVGAAFVPCDPSHPRSRLQSIFQQVDARVVLCCTSAERMCLELLPHGQTIVVAEESGFDAVSTQNAIFSGVKPHNPLYICFTSGTSGTPKGTVITHQAYCSGARDHSKALHFERTSRFLQFASYTFDTSIEDILTTLISGGCLCIPSEEERISDIPGAIARMNVTVADLTPSYISSISPDSVPSLKQITLGGEPITANVIKTWANRVRLINAYGTTECCVTSICREVSADTHPANIGHPVGAIAWIVAADNSDQLLPIGAVGELLIEGPAMAEGYLNDKEKTAAAFISSPKWARNVNSQLRPSRLYKTGDIAQYNSDGSINYLGRKDTRMKLRGLRIEMGDVEHHLLSHPSIRRAMVALPTTGPYSDQLTAILELDSASEPRVHTEIDVMSKSELEVSAFKWASVSAHLNERLPAYMTPSSWIVIKVMPLHSSGKLDRSKLGKWLADLPEKCHNDVCLSSSNISLISSDDHVALEISKMIAQLTSSSKQGDPGILGHDVNVSSIGIDSIKMMSLAAFIKRLYGVAVAMPLLIHHQTKISDISKYIAVATNSKNAVVSEQTPGVDLMNELLTLDHDLASFQHHFGVIFLTGASGFLGIQLLRELLNRPGVDKVIAHVRATDEAHGKQRIINAAKAAKWWSDSLAPKLEVWAGDLAKPMLGLSTTQWQTLQKTSAIIHNGASVKWNENYHSLKAANVTSTFSLLKMTTTAPCPPKFVYVSGGRDFPPSMTDQEITTMMETEDGYSQTKLVSELLVRNFARRATPNQHVSIIKPGLIIGTAEEGVANITDFIWRYVAGAMNIGFYPIPAKDDWLRVANVDRVANTTINLLLRRSEDTQGDNHNQSHTTEVLVGINMRKFWSVVNAHVDQDKQLQPVGAEEWYKLVQRDLEEKTEEHPLWPVAHLLAEEGNLGKGGRLMHGDGDEMAAKEVEVALGKNVEFLREIGYFGEGK
ncbi:hypothetical protein ACMFMG_001647 [Clarireedia jacksonii]